MRHLFDHNRDIEGFRFRELPSEEKRIRVMVATLIGMIIVFTFAYFRFPFF